MLELKEDSIYHFRLSYPVGYLDINENRIPYFKFDLLLKDMNGRLMVYDSMSEKFITFLEFEFKERENEIQAEGTKVKVSIDTSFNISGRDIYEVRMKHLYHSNFDPPLLGQDFVFFLSPRGIEGMYISNTEVFLYHIKEKVNAPVGEIFYKRNNAAAYEINE